MGETEEKIEKERERKIEIEMDSVGGREIEKRRGRGEDRTKE